MMQRPAVEDLPVSCTVRQSSATCSKSVYLEIGSGPSSAGKKLYTLHVHATRKTLKAVHVAKAIGVRHLAQLRLQQVCLSATGHT